MSLVPITPLLMAAEEAGYAVGAFNGNNLEIIQAIIMAAEAEASPVILQASQGAIKYAGLDYLATLGKIAAEKARVPVALHLDHGTSFAQVVACIQSGFTSVMIDGSALPLAENITLTKKVVEVAHAVGVSVEAEIGRIPGTEEEISVGDREALFTDPEEAQQFVAETGVDTLAVAVGTAHGRYRGVPQLDFSRLEKIKQLVKIPLVLHGSSGVPDEMIREAISRGVRKINIDTNIREAFVRGLRQAWEKNPEEIDPRRLLGPAREEMALTIREKIRLFGSAGRA